MSDLSIYELEDIVWEFGDSDDHIVPLPEGKKSPFLIDSDSSKRPRLEPRCTEINAGSYSASDAVLQKKEGTTLNAVKDKEKMLDNRPWTHLPSGGFSPSLDEDSCRKNSCSTSDEERTFDQCMRNSNMDPVGNGLSTNDLILGDQAASVDNSLFQYQLNNATPTESDLGFFGNSLDDKEGNDLLYYGWTDIENFEDVDRMFRSCDSTFGLDIDNNGELGWLSSSHAIAGSNDSAEPNLKISGCGTSGLESPTEQQEVNEFNINGLVADESDQKLAAVNFKRSSLESPSNGSSTVMNATCVNGPGVTSSIDAKSQIHAYVSEPPLQKSSEGKRKECSLENGASFIQFDNLKHVDESKHPVNFQCSFLSENHQLQEGSHCTCMQVEVPLVNPNSSNSSNQVLPSMISSIIKSEDSGIPSISPRESSYASNQMQSVESACDGFLQKPPVSKHKKKDRQHQCRISACSEKGNVMVQRHDPDPICPKKLSNFDNEVEGQSEVDGDVGIVTELDSPNIQESSSLSSVLDEISIDTSSFQQLQDVMEKLDIRTKLCIRDSLYRLARSAERRHKCLNPSGGDNDDKDTSGALLSDGTNKCTGFMDMETDTNPIDRSIAHLLFHRPPDPSATAPFDTLPVKSHPMVQAHHNGPSVAEKPTCQEETTSANGQVAEH